MKAAEFNRETVNNLLKFSEALTQAITGLSLIDLDKVDKIEKYGIAKEKKDLVYGRNLEYAATGRHIRFWVGLNISNKVSEFNISFEPLALGLNKDRIEKPLDDDTFNKFIDNFDSTILQTFIKNELMNIFKAQEQKT